MNWHRWDDYLRFHTASLASGDVDPVYPVLRLGVQGKSEEDKVRAVLAHVAYYHFGSTVVALHLLDRGVRFRDLPVLPCGTERRAHRDTRKLRTHLAALDVLCERPGGAAEALAAPTFELVAEKVSQIYGNGRWASFKVAEMLSVVAGWDLPASELAILDSSGPSKGLRLLLPGEPVSEELALQLVDDLRAAGARATPETVETTLCDFHSLTRGHYYVGHDIDQMLGQINAVREDWPEAPWDEVFKARAHSFPHEYLGELNGWEKPDPARSKAYRDGGRVVLR